MTPGGPGAGGGPEAGGGPGDVVVRTAVPEDAAILARLLAEGAILAKEDPSDPAPYADALADIAATPGNEVFVAVLGGEVVGMCQLITFRHVQERGGWCAEIESVHVAEPLRSRGIGSVLIDAAVARARELGCYRVQLTSNKARTDAHRFYHRLGFTDTHEGFKRYL